MKYDWHSINTNSSPAKKGFEENSNHTKPSQLRKENNVRIFLNNYVLVPFDLNRYEINMRLTIEKRPQKNR